MKVTALIPDDIVAETQKYSGGKNITESLLIALRDYLDRQKIRKAIKRVKANPLEFRRGFAAAHIRKLNRAQ
jgi:hypothetical protein